VTVTHKDDRRSTATNDESPPTSINWYPYRMLGFVGFAVVVALLYGLYRHVYGYSDDGYEYVEYEYEEVWWEE